MAFDPTKDPQPPVSDIHLKLDNHAFRWMTQLNVNKIRKSQWQEDRWAAEAEEWKQRYGDKYTGYHAIPGGLEGD